MTERLPHQTLFLAALVFFSLVGWLFYATLGHQVFPSASIDLKLSKAEATKNSEQFAQLIGYDLRGAFKSTTFTCERDQKTLLELKLGLAKANELMRSAAPIWLWCTRFCKSYDHEQLSVWWTTSGQLQAFVHTIDENRKIDSVSQAEALRIASAFVSNTAHLGLDGFKIYYQGSKKRTNRIDYDFYWEKYDHWPQSTMTICVKLAGNQVKEFRWELTPIDTWQRFYKKMRERNELFSSVSFFFFYSFLIVTAVEFMKAVAERNLRWSFALKAAGLVAMLALLDRWNNFSYLMHNYNPAKSIEQFLTESALFSLISAVGTFLAALIVAGGAEVVYRRVCPNELAIEHIFTPKGLSFSSSWLRIIVGYLLPGVMFFWKISYYRVGELGHFYCPLGVSDFNVLGTYCPAISGALLGLRAAGLEELIFRVVALGLLRKVTGDFWFANLLQAAIWGFGHSSYPQQPAYARGIELTVEGFLFGAIFKYFGILPVFIAHYFYDAFVTAEPVFASHSMALIAPVILILFPFAVAAWLSSIWVIRHREKVNFELMCNENLVASPPSKEAKEIPTITYSSLSHKTRFGLLCISAVAILLSIIIPNRTLGGKVQLAIDSDRAVSNAFAVMKSHGLSISGYQTIAQLYAWPSRENKETWQYMFEKLGFEEARKLFNTTQPGLVWSVRAFKPGSPREYIVVLDSEGRELKCQVKDSIVNAGAQLDSQSARQQAEDYISQHWSEFVPFVFDSERDRVGKKRNDYEFDFSVPKYKVGDARCCLTVKTLGAAVWNVYQYWDLPDQWKWEKQKPRFHQQIVTLLSIVAGIGSFSALACWIVVVLRATRIPWKLVSIITAIATVCMILQSLNHLQPQLYLYNTAQTIQSFLSVTVLNKVGADMLRGCGIFLLCLAGLTSAEYSFNGITKQISSAFLLLPKNPANQRWRTAIWADACLSSYALIGLIVLLLQLRDFLSGAVLRSVPLENFDIIVRLFTQSFPMLGLPQDLITIGLIIALSTALIAGFAKKHLHSSPCALLVMAISALLICGTERYLKEWVITSIILFSIFVLVWLFAVHIFQKNALAYLLVALELNAVLYLWSLIEHTQKVGLSSIAVYATILIVPWTVLALSYFRDSSIKSSLSPD